MKLDPIIKSLKRKFKCKTNTDLGKAIGVTPQHLQQWKNKSAISPNQIATLAHKSFRQGQKDSKKATISPIIEYYPINRTKSSHDKKWHILSKKNALEKQIIDYLKEAQGIYLFYDSMYQPIYIGRTKHQDLWFEINDAFNRERRGQQVRRVKHPRQGRIFKPAYDMIRKIVKETPKLHEISTYISAYGISKSHISIFEALLIRTAANVCTNSKMENF